jgi:hypothetical protein
MNTEFACPSKIDDTVLFDYTEYFTDPIKLRAWSIIDQVAILKIVVGATMVG